jgi:hypothetical protein
MGIDRKPPLNEISSRTAGRLVDRFLSLLERQTEQIVQIETGRESMNRSAELRPRHSIEGKPCKPRASTADSGSCHHLRFWPTARIAFRAEPSGPNLDPHVSGC